MQHIDVTGYPLWTVNWISVYPNVAAQVLPALCEDGAGGVIVAWSDTRVGLRDVYAQRVDDNGTLLWNAGGVLVCNGSDEQYVTGIASDGVGGAFIVWDDYRYGASDVDIYINHVDATGSLA